MSLILKSIPTLTTATPIDGMLMIAHDPGRAPLDKDVKFDITALKTFIGAGWKLTGLTTLTGPTEIKYSASAASGNVTQTYFELTQTAASTGVHFGLYSKARATHAAGTVNQVIAGQFNGENVGAGTVTNLRGALGSTLTTNGPVNTAIGILAEGIFIAGNAAVTNSYALYIGAATIGAGSITNNYGLYQADATAKNAFNGYTLVGGGTVVTAANAFNVAYNGSAATGNKITQGISIVQSVASTGVHFASYVKANAVHTTGTINQMLAIQGNAENADAGTVTNLRGILGGTLTTNGPVTNAVGVLAEGVFIAGNATVTNSYALYVGSATIGSGAITNNYGVYQVDANALNVFNGRVQLTASATHAGLQLGTKSSTDPSTTAQGLLYYNTTSNQARLYDGTAWRYVTLNSGMTDNRVQYASSNKLVDSANLIFDGSKLGVGGTPALYTLEVMGSSNPTLRIINSGTNNTEFIMERTGGTASAWRWYLNSGVTQLRLFTNSADRFYWTDDGSYSIGVPSLASGQKVFFISNATAVPSGTPSGGGVVYVEAGALKYKGTSGTVTTIANA